MQSTHPRLCSKPAVASRWSVRFKKSATAAVSQCAEQVHSPCRRVLTAHSRPELPHLQQHSPWPSPCILAGLPSPNPSSSPKSLSAICLVPWFLCPKAQRPLPWALWSVPVPTPSPCSILVQARQNWTGWGEV